MQMSIRKNVNIPDVDELIFGGNDSVVSSDR